MAAAKRRNLTLDLSPVRTSQFDELVLRPFVRKGDPFDGYVDIEEVGLGAFGSVYQAKSRSGGNPKAIKVVNAGPGETDKILKALNEAQIGMQIDHPNILLIQQVMYDGTRFLFVMDLVEPLTVSSPSDLSKKSLKEKKRAACSISAAYFSSRSLGFKRLFASRHQSAKYWSKTRQRWRAALSPF